MKRKELIKQLIAAVIFCAGGLITCAKEELPRVNFQVDLTDQAYGKLKKVGKSKLVNGVLIVHYKKNDYRAVLPACTFEGTNVKYDSTTTKFICPNHGDEFDKDGRVIKGPAALNLHRYNIRIDSISIEKKHILIITSL